MRSGKRCNPRTGSGYLLVVGVLLGSGCVLEDPFSQLDGGITLPPWLLGDAGQVIPGADASLPEPSDPQPAEAGALEDAAALPTDPEPEDAATIPPELDAGAPAEDAEVPQADAEAPEMDGQAPTSDAQTEPPSSDVCSLWKAERVDLREGTWTGSTATCSAGELSAEGLGNALRLFNLYRNLVGLDPLPPDAEANRRAQSCALLMAANGTITHTPPASWKCYSAEAAATAGSASISTGPAVTSVDLYVLDSGNTSTLGHRRWIFSNWLTSVGFGTAGRFSCQYQPSRQSSVAAGKPWVAWPAGRIPYQVFNQRSGSLDRIGWSIQSDSINLQSAQVSVTKAGTALPVSVSRLPTGYGSRYALRIVPQGWSTEAGATYEVSITGTSTPINYSVEVVNCAP